MGFQQDFAKTPWGPQREQLVYRAAISQGKPTDLWPITVDGPDGTKITYYITRDFLKVDGQYLVMSGTTAQKVADYFGMYLPTNTIADQVWRVAKAKLTVHPLSGTGYQGADGRWHTGEDVSKNRIRETDAAVEYSNRVNKAIENNPEAKTQLVDIGSGAKWLTAPPANGSLGLHGIRQPQGVVQSGYGTMHRDYEEHTEYGTYVRLVADRVDITYPDGRTEITDMKSFAKSDLHSALFVDGQDIRGGSIARYDLKRDKANLGDLDREVGSKPGEMVATKDLPVGFQNWQDVDAFLGHLETQGTTARMKFLNRIVKHS